jgi:hypothetical protein
VSAPRLLHNLHTKSLAKAVLDGLKDRECKKIALRKRPPIPYVPKKDCVQKTVSAFKDNHLKTQIGKLRNYVFLSGTPVHTRHPTSMWDLPWKLSKKRGNFKTYVVSNKAYVEQRGRIKLVKAQLAKLDDCKNGGVGS